MVAEYLRTIDGIEIFGVAGLLFSIILFIGVLIWTFRADRAYIRMMERLPLDPGNATREHSEKAHS
jgi:flagellar biogenesis protein FliO